MMRDYNWNPYKDNWRSSDQYQDSNWDYDPRDQNYYLGRINQSGNNDMSREYFADDHTDRYYRRSELENKKGTMENDYQVRDPYKNNDFYGHRKRNYSYEGPHRGKGPKNYMRPPERIKDDAADRLMEDSLVDASNIDIDVKDNDLILSGTVNSRFEKHRAEALVENVSGVKEVQNNLRVQGEKATAPHTFG
ncbi:MAG: BON domain-containing protein [Ginsengibacter sp.]